MFSHSLHTLVLAFTTSRLFVALADASHFLDGWIPLEHGLLQEIDYFIMSAANITKCKKLCQRQKMCVAVAYDAVNRDCFIGNNTWSAYPTTGSASTGKKYALQNVSDLVEKHRSINDCADNQLLVAPAIQTRRALCVNISYDCPHQKGYVGRLYDNMMLCLRYGSTPSKFSDANNTCYEEGGHLALIEGEEMRKNVVMFLSGQEVKGPVYFDGYDFSGANNFISWKGTPLPWLRWGANNPDDYDGDDCIVGSHVDEYLSRDTKCFVLFTYVCQIDML